MNLQDIVVWCVFIDFLLILLLGLINIIAWDPNDNWIERFWDGIGLGTMIFFQLAAIELLLFVLYFCVQYLFFS